MPTPAAHLDRSPPRDALLVVGCGNELRGDDGAGVRAASLVAECCPVARVIVVRQLTPELAADIALAARVVFIDAYAASGPCAPLRTERLMPNAASGAPLLAHCGDPAVLLDLCARLYDHVPETWVVGIPAFCCTAGAAISSATARRIDDAVAFCTVRVLGGQGE